MEILQLPMDSRQLEASSGWQKYTQILHRHQTKFVPCRRRMNMIPIRGLGMNAMPRNGLLVMAFRKPRTEAPIAAESILQEFLTNYIS